MAHDACRNTKLYKYAGQNLAIFGTTATLDIDNCITNSIQGWVNEIAYMSSTEVASYPDNL